MSAVQRWCRRIAVPVSIAVVAATANALPARATDPVADPAASAVVVGLLRLSTALGAASSQPVLSTDLPLTDVSVRDVLNLDTALGDRVVAAVTGADPTLDTLPGIISADSALDMTPAPASPGAPAGSREWLLTVDLPGVVPVALRYQDARLQFGAAELDGELAATLRGTLRLRYDASALALRRFSVVGESLLTTHAWSRAHGGTAVTGQQVSVPAFPAIDGFVQIAGSGHATVDTTSVLRLRDPNGRGALTTEDFQFGTATELFAVQDGPGADDVRMDIDLRSDRLDADPHGAVTVGTRAVGSTKPYADPAVTRDAALDRLTSLTRAQAVAGFAQFTAAILAAESQVDAELPLLDAKLTDLFSPGNQLLTMLSEQATATVRCGAANTNPPTGSPRPGQVRYCQAVTDGLSVDAGTPVTWTSPEAGVTFGATAGTVGTAPTANVAVTGGGGFPRLRVTFTSGGVTRSARSLVTSVQELGAIVGELGLGGTVTYDAVNQALELAVAQADPDVTKTVPTGGNGSLAPLTGLAGLCQAKPATTPRVCPRTGDPAPEGGTRTEPQAGQATLTATGRAIHATFGIGLVPAAAAPVEGAAAPAQPVTYLKPGAGGVLWQIGDVNASLPTNAQLVARIGFLQVDVDVTHYDLTNAGTAARVTVPTGDVDVAGGTVSGAVDILRLLGPDPAQGGSASPVTMTATRHLTAAATLDVKDAPGATTPRPLDAEGTVAATWNNLAAGALPTVVTGGAYARLRLLDLVPSREGTMGAGTTGHTLVDPAADFEHQFGIEAGGDRVVTKPLHDLDAARDVDPDSAAGTVCTEFTVTDAHTLSCTKGPLATAGMAVGHAYLVDGEPTALRDVLIEDLAGILSVYATPEQALRANDTLPLVDLRPDQISAARRTLTTVVTHLREDASNDTATSDVSTLQGFAGAIKQYAPSSVTTLTLPAGTTRLEVRTQLDSAAQTTFAPLRAAAGTRQLQVFDGVDAAGAPAPVTLPLTTSSSADLRLAIDLADASSYVNRATSVTESVTGLASAAAQVRDSLAGKVTTYGAADAKTGAAAGIEAGIGVDVTTAPQSGADPWLPLAQLRAALRQTRSRHGAAQTCNGTASGAETAACLTLPLVEPGPPGAALTTVHVALRADESSGGTGASLDNQPLAYRFLADGLAAFSRSLGSGLDGDVAGMSMPLVGTDLDAGADVPAAVTAFAGAARGALTAVTTTPSETSAEFATALGTALSGVHAPDVTVSAVTATATCATACAATAKVDDVVEVTAPIHLSGNKSGQTSPFRPGLAGLALDSDLDVPTTTSWSVDVVLGIRRGSGPFLLLKPASGQTTVPVLHEHVTATLPLYTAANCHDWARAAISKANAAKAVPASQAATARCLDAFVGKLPSVLVDRTDAVANPHDTGVDANLTVSVTPGAGGAGPADVDGRVYLPALFDQKLPTTTTATGSGGLDLYFESFAAEIGFFDVVGSIALAWDDGAFATDGAHYDSLEIDAKTVYDILDTGYAKAKKWLAPLNPVLDVLSAPIPVATQLAALAGQPPVTLLSILVKLHASVALVLKLVEFQQLIARLPGGGSSPELVDLGSGRGGKFVLPAQTIQRNSCAKTVDMTKQGGLAFTHKSSGFGTSGRCDEGALSKIKRKRNGTAPTDPTAGKNIQKQTTKSVYFSLPSISVPVLEDATQVFDLLMGEGDTTLLYVDLGHIGGKVSMVRNFGPFMIGPVPVVASIGGTIGIDGRFAFGFDTRGLTKKIEALDDPGDVHGLTSSTRAQVFSDGFFIDDLEHGVDVPEIKLVVTITAGASVSIGFAEAGLRGGIVLDLSLDAFDPNSDGKIYADEFAGGTGPDCAFDVSSGLQFFLEFYFHVDLFLFSIDKSFDIVRSPRIVLFEFNCDRSDPVLAYREPGSTDLWLTMGSKAAGHRNGFAGVTKESYTVRQLGPDPAGGGTLVQVSAFNLVQSYVVAPGAHIRADGAGDDDTIRLYPGQVATQDADGATTVTNVPFTIPANVDGGAGHDKITTGDGADTVTGGAGNDSIETGGGADTVHGNDGNDTIDSGGGHDDVTGDDGDDHVSGGPGTDQARGGTGDDVVDGGPGALPSQLFPTTDPAVIGPLLDAGDLVVGDDGNDQVKGGDGSDVAVGGDYDTTGAAYTGTQTLHAFGVTPTGHLTEVVVTTPTLVLPSLSQVRAECALDGTAGTGRDDVTGGSDRDYVLGSAGADTLSGGGGADVVCGRAGDDLLDGDGSDVVPADEGADEVHGGPGRDRIYGSGGADTMYGDAGDDLARGGPGNDTAEGGTGSDLLLGEAGADTLLGDNSGTPSAAEGDAREITCAASTSVVNGGIDLNGDLSANGLDDGQLEGLAVTDGLVRDAADAAYTGMLGNVVFIAGRADLDGNGSIVARSVSRTGDTGAVELAGMTGAVGDGDCLLGGDAADTALNGQDGGDYVDAGDGDDTVVRGGPGADLVRGGNGADTERGDAGNDLVAGDAGDDLLLGGTGDDVLRGSSGNDLLAGGTDTANATDGRDELLGDGGDDVLAGGNASMARTAGADTAIAGRAVTLLATPASGSGLDDQLFGGYGDDWAFGQNGDDSVRGGPDKDVVEGGPGADTVAGDDGDDLAVGGSSTAAGVTVNRSGAGQPDGADTVLGDAGVDGIDGSDVLAGDNARLDPEPASGGVARTRWARVRPLVALELFDAPTTVAPDATTSGGDTMSGGGGNDLVVGQSGDDTVSGGAGDDAVEGNAGDDTVTGDDGNDELVGGSWTGGSYDASAPGRFDHLEGNGGNDVLVGDNGSVTPQVRLYDVPAPGATVAASSAGRDELLGGDGNDTAFGQSADDTLSGGDGADALEGDAGTDTVAGGAGDDVLVGGGSALDGVIAPTRLGNTLPDSGDSLSGDGGDDVLAGDNARVDAQPGTVRADGTALRTVRLFDVESAGSPMAGAADTLAGGTGRDLLFGQGGDDTIGGGDGDDVLEGNAGQDRLAGEGGEDDLVGGGSVTSGIVISGTGAGDRLLSPPAGLTDTSAAGMLDGDDALYGGFRTAPPAGAQADAADVILGDNGRVTRNGAVLGGHAVRAVAMADATPGVTSGSDLLVGSLGDDELYGQLDDTGDGGGQSVGAVLAGGDVLYGDEGDDALVGDQGVDVPTPAAALGAVNTTLSENGSFVTELVRQAGSLVRVVTTTQPAVGGDDVLFGGTGNDSLHAGAGADLANADDGDDVVFGADGNDALWGGGGHDRLFGGTGGDFLDIKKRTGDPALWQVVAPAADTDNRKATVNGADTTYGGSGADAAQADVGDNGRTPGDRLIDWTGVFNLYLVCTGAYGSGKIQNSPDPATQSMLTELARSTGSVGPGELALVPVGGDTNPKYPGAPGNFTCETA
jgi:Ca2+-binding RTX toxin-like protein